MQYKFSAVEELERLIEGAAFHIAIAVTNMILAGILGVNVFAWAYVYIPSTLAQFAQLLAVWWISGKLMFYMVEKITLKGGLF